MVGITVHGPGEFNPAVLKPGMVFTIGSPGVYITKRDPQGRCAVKTFFVVGTGWQVDRLKLQQMPFTRPKQVEAAMKEKGKWREHDVICGIESIRARIEPRLQAFFAIQLLACLEECAAGVGIVFRLRAKSAHEVTQISRMA